MGRDASRVTLEVCLQSRPNVCIIRGLVIMVGLQDVIDYFATVF